jgi:hypothetical protein
MEKYINSLEGVVLVLVTLLMTGGFVSLAPSPF